MQKYHWIKIAASTAALAVVLGAFAAHGLKARLDAQALQTFQTAVYYQMVHSLGLLAVLVLPLNEDRQRWVARLFIAGIVLFSGSLYLMVLADLKTLGWITPLGGLAFIAGWLTLISAAQPVE